MFFNFMKRNSRKTRKENGVYFASLIVSIVAFYVILSLGEQDVMQYLQTIESQAVGKLMLLIPVLYGVSLVFVFFLVYFANRYQLKQRSHEFGLYMMMGMKQRKLFFMLMGEVVWNSLVALGIGLPIALFLTELINLVTSRLVGMGIVGHVFRISWTGLLLTVCGFFLVQLVAMLKLSFTMSRKEPLELLHENKEQSQATMAPKWGAVSLVSGTALLFGTIFLGTAYALAVLYFRNFDYRIFALIIIVGLVGTFTLFRGLGSLISAYVKKKGTSTTGLSMFTARQLQENVLHQWSSLAISSLLILMAVVCFAFGTTSALTQDKATRTVDYTFNGDKKDIEEVVKSDEVAPYVDQFYGMAVESYSNEDDRPIWSSVLDEVSKAAPSESKDVLMNNFSQALSTYFISLSSYNDMLQAAGKEPITLSDDEVAIYSSDISSAPYKLLQHLLHNEMTVEIEDKEYSLAPNLYADPIVADREISLMYALIVPNTLYDTLFTEADTWLWNMTLKDDYVQEKGLMQAMLAVNQVLQKTDVQFESYLSSMGRQLFYTVAATYTTFYLGVMFLLIANTVLGLNFLMQQRSTRSRYETLMMLGASVSSICQSARKQIWLYFILAISVALVSGVFGIWTLVTALPATEFNARNIVVMGLVVLLFIGIEVLYVRMIQRKSDAEIQKLNDID